jgi:hypothetical protein
MLCPTCRSSKEQLQRKVAALTEALAKRTATAEDFEALRRELRAAHARVASERARADAAVESSRRAWRAAMGGLGRDRRSGPTQTEETR